LSNLPVAELTISDKSKIEHLLNKEPSFNGFVVSDLEYGHYAPEFVRLYGQVDGDALISILIIFNDKLCITHLMIICPSTATCHT
jgi:hypothetical protein